MSTTTKVLSNADLKALSERSDVRGAIRVAVHAGLLTGAGWLVAVSSGWTLLPAMLLLGIVQARCSRPSTRRCT